VKYVILIHANPEPWGHPTSAFTPEGRAQPAEYHELLTELVESGEFVVAEALADPASSSLYRWSPQGHVAADGPYAESKEHLAGFFLIDVADRTRAEQVAARFAGPGSTIELRPAMWPGGPDD
jgi:hypothetical protein